MTRSAIADRLHGALNDRGGLRHGNIQENHPAQQRLENLQPRTQVSWARALPEMLAGQAEQVGEVMGRLLWSAAAC
jgi:hypothetical protein